MKLILAGVLAMASTGLLAYLIPEMPKDTLTIYGVLMYVHFANQARHDETQEMLGSKNEKT